ncbi:MAG: DUF4230 domain-containing protein [Anaerolineae bacterium]|jgi:hypothetical protein|nr:DUF4230 domain-containing protein [Anaerolineae bacterium]MBT7075984.1 DUF4230 domain-containing protein [Anaerolineae bacterium]MBT7783741.1 DUF4230 domain-containing protein [Anaerolineae bacterium]
MKKNIVPTLLLIIVAASAYFIVQSVQESAKEAQNAVKPFSDASNAMQTQNSSMQTQVSDLLHPTPTIIPDPVTIIHDVQSLARLETIQYSVEKVITAEIGQGTFDFLFGDKLLFVAHGVVIAGIDLEKLGSDNLKLEGGTLYVTLPLAEVFIATLDNEKSYVYDRETGALTHGDTNLETTARQAAEDEIYKAAMEDGILKLAQQNAEHFLEKFFETLGYKHVIFLDS